MSNTSNRMRYEGKNLHCKKCTLVLIWVYARLAGKVQQSMLWTTKKTQKWDSIQYLFVLRLYLSFCLLSSTSLNFTLPFAFAVLLWDLKWGLKHLRDFCPCKWSLTEHSILVLYRVNADVSKLICLIMGGKISEYLRLLQYFPIQLPHPENSPAFNDAGYLLAKSLLPISPLNSCKLLLQTLSRYFSQCWNLKVLNVTLKFPFIQCLPRHPES